MEVSNLMGAALRALDLYSGIGGWGIGLRLAGIDVAMACEWWAPAARTYAKNMGPHVKQVDIRSLALTDLPKKIDFVVGSPPCTEFSYSNRGGSGDIAEGLKDVRAFLNIVQHVRPKFWVMENVPRVADILRKEIQEGGQLSEFGHLIDHIDVFDMSDFGVPQRRKRCIAGRYPRHLLVEYQKKTTKHTLGHVVKTLSGKVATDPIYGIRLSSNEVSDHLKEAFLNKEEARMNSEAKSFHPVYNNMPFPDPLNRAVRTITATCTRVSRESVVIEDAGRYRRLTVRERAMLQSFPINYQFFADSHAQKAKMIGNAVPPAFTFLIAQALLETPIKRMRLPNQVGDRLGFSEEKGNVTKPEQEGKSYPVTRRFRAAIPGLRFKSGLRFELANGFSKDAAEWSVDFYYGSSKDIVHVRPNEEVWRYLVKSGLEKSLQKSINSSDVRLLKLIDRTSPSTLQDVWSHRASGTSPYDVADEIGAYAEAIRKALEKLPGTKAEEILLSLLQLPKLHSGEVLQNEKKLRSYALPILSGFVAASRFNFFWSGSSKYSKAAE